MTTKSNERHDAAAIGAGAETLLAIMRDRALAIGDEAAVRHVDEALEAVASARQAITGAAQ